MSSIGLANTRACSLSRIRSMRIEADSITACSHVRDAAPGSPRVHVRERPPSPSPERVAPRQLSFIPTEPLLSATYHLTCGLAVPLLARVRAR